MMTSKPEGFPVNISGREYICSPLSLKDLDAIPRSIVRVDDTQFVIAIVNIMAKIVRAALLPNYPEITLDEVRDILHFGNGEVLLEAIKRDRPIVDAFAGAMAAMAAIPYVGPALAAVAGPETYAAAMAYLPLAIAEGGWDVDRGGLSMIHSKEMVLPADLAEGVRGMVRGGGRAGPGNASTVINNHIQSWDSRDMGQFMKRNGRAMLTSLAYSARAWGVR